MEGKLRQTHLLPKRITLRFGPFDFHPRRHELHRHGHRISMSASQMRLLTLFMERPGELITREEIAERLWIDTRNIDVPTGINTAINRLRKLLQISPGAPPSIETVIGLGYRFVPDLEEVSPEEPESIEASVAPSSFQVEPVTHDAPGTAEHEPEAVGVIPHPDPYPPRRNPVLPLRHLITDLSSRRFTVLALCGVVLLGAVIFSTLHWRTSRVARNTSATSSAIRPQETPLVRVTADEDLGKLTAAAVAPNGDSVAYADRFGVSVHWFASGTERLLGVRPSFTVDRLSWFPDQRRLLMSGTDTILHRQQVWLVPVQGAYLRLLAQDANRATVSPDGSSIAFTRNHDQELWLAGSDGQNPRRLRVANPGEHFALILWSPAGRRLMVTLRRGQSGADSPGTPDPSSQGAHECISTDAGQVLAREEGFFASSGYMLHDGRFFFIENKTAGPTTGEADLMVVQTELSSGRFLGAPKKVRGLYARHADSLTASSSGERFAAVLDRAEMDVFIAKLHQPGPELTDVVRLTRSGKQNFPHSWAADARGIILENDSLGKFSIFNQPLDGSEPALIAKLPESVAMAQLSPDGRWILFLQFTGQPQHATGIFRVPATGGPIEQVPTQGNIEEFHCSASPVGRCVLREAIANEALVYYALDPLQGMGSELARTRWQPNRLGDWGLSADGRMVAFASHDTLQPGIGLIWLDAQPHQVQGIPLSGHGTPLGANWAPDGRTLFVECRTETGFELVSLDLAGHAKLLRQSPSLIWAVPSRDGRKLAFPGLTLSASLWASNS